MLEISRVSQRMARLDMTWDCRVNRADELGILANNLNTMARRLDTAMKALESANEKLREEMAHITELSRQRRDFFAAASHELKTPLTILKGQIESMILGIGKYKDAGTVLPETLKEVENMERLVKEILTISKIEMEGLAGKTAPVPLSDTLAKVTEALLPLARERQIAVQSEIAGDVAVSGNASLLEKALHNVLSNAIRHSPEGAKVLISGGDACAQTMASVMGVKAEKVARQVAFVRCAGSTARDKGIYEGIPDCLAATKVAGRGPLICKFGCLGFGNCTKACQFDAIHLEQGVVKVDPDKCTGCMSCAAACPRHIIVPVHYGAHITVACSSTARGSVTLRGCDIGCIGCSKCQKACPKGAITVASSLARVDYSLCDGCGLCVEVCPRGLISNSHLTQEDAGRILKPANPVS